MSEFPKLKNLRVLFVDDNREMQRFLRSLLSSMDIVNIRGCFDAESCLQMMAEQPADIIITDLVLGSGNGLDLIRRIRQAERNVDYDTPILVLTGQVSVADVLAARDAGATEFLAKPVSFGALHDRLVWMIENPRPFIKAVDFIGPDRRRRSAGGFGGAERRKR